MRNETFTLDAAQDTLDQNVILFVENACDDGHTLTVEYVKRDGTHSTATGTLVALAGTPGQSTSALKVETERGFRTINTWRVLDMAVTLECGSTVVMPGLPALAAWAGVR